MLILMFSTDTSQEAPQPLSQNEMRTSTPTGATPQVNPMPQSLESMLRQADLKGM